MTVREFWLKWRSHKIPSEPVRVVVTAGGGPNPIAIYDDKTWLAGGDTLTIGLGDQPVVVKMGPKPVRLKLANHWYEVGKELFEP